VNWNSVIKDRDQKKNLAKIMAFGSILAENATTL